MLRNICKWPVLIKYWLMLKYHSAYRIFSKYGSPLIMAPPSLWICKMFDFTKVNVSKYFLFIFNLLFDHLWGNDILNVDLRDGNHVIYTKYLSQFLM